MGLSEGATLSELTCAFFVVFLCCVWITRNIQKPKPTRTVTVPANHVLVTRDNDKIVRAYRPGTHNARGTDIYWKDNRESDPQRFIDCEWRPIRATTVLGYCARCKVRVLDAAHAVTWCAGNVVCLTDIVSELSERMPLQTGQTLTDLDSMYLEDLVNSADIGLAIQIVDLKSAADSRLLNKSVSDA